MTTLDFDWDADKECQNIEKHGVSFEEAIDPFFDVNRIIALDHDHSTANETRYYCFGRGERGIMTVRFTLRANKTRIIGAGYWRKGRKTYEQKNRKI